MTASRSTRPQHRITLAAAIVTALSGLTLAAPSHAEEGDYSAWQTLANLVSPPKADNKVTACLLYTSRCV